MDNKDKAEQTQTAGAARQGGITSEAFEEIAKSWDGCEYDAIGQTMDIGASLRHQFAHITAPSPASLASQSQAAQPTELTPERIYALWKERGGDGAPAALRFARAIESEVVAHIAGTSQATKAQAEPTIPAHLSEFVQAVANDFTAYDEGDDEHYCRGCSALIVNEAPGTQHQDDCIVPRAKAALAAPVAKEAPAVLEGWLSYIDPECETEQDKRLSTVSGFRAGQALDEICRLLGGRWPVAKMQEEAPKAYRFFMELFGAAPVASVAKEATRDAETTEKANVLPPFAAPAGQQDADERAFNTLYGAVMNIPCQAIDAWGCIAVNHYKLGHRDARHAAADLIAEFASGFREGRNTKPAGTEIGSDIATTTSTVSAREMFNRAFPPPSMELPTDEYDALVEKRAEQWEVWKVAAPSSTEGAQKAPEEVRNQALEEAAKVCESEDQQHEIGRCCAVAIRALRTSSTDQANADTGSAE